MRVLDLFCGLKGWSKPFEERGHEVISLDFNPKFEPTICEDIFDVSASTILQNYGPVELVLASPDCAPFSMGSAGHHWGGGKRAYQPKTEAASVAIEIVAHTVELIQELEPRWAIIENPRDVLRNLGLIPVDPVTIWYCHYGERHAKPTDLWGMSFPEHFKPRPECHNRQPKHGEDCCCHTDHDPAPRGAKTGTQGLNGYAVRSKIPRELAVDVMNACEADL